MAWQLSKRQLAAHSLFYCGLVVGGLLFARSLAPPFPEPLEGVRMEPLSPLIDESEVSPENGMFLLLPWAREPVPPRPVRAIEGIWRRGVAGEENEVRAWLAQEEGRIQLMRKALAAPEFVWPTNRLDQIEEHLHSLSDTYALQIVLSSDGEEALGYLEEGLREASRMYSAPLVRLEFVGEEQFGALLRGALTRWLYGKADSLEQRKRAVEIVRGAHISAWGEREAEKVRWWLATDFPRVHSRWYSRMRWESRCRRVDLSKKYMYAQGIPRELGESLADLLECSKEETKENIRAVYSHNIGALERGELLAGEGHPAYRLLTSPQWAMALGADPVGREMIRGRVAGESTFGGEIYSKSTIERLRTFAVLAMEYRILKEKGPERSHEEHRQVWSKTWGEHAMVEVEIDGEYVRFLDATMNRGNRGPIALNPLDLNKWGTSLHGPYLHWPRE